MLPETRNQLSLLWSERRPTETWTMPVETVRDLEIGVLIAELCPHEPYREAVAPIVKHRDALRDQLRSA